jgi:SAM-dependent methyltransferase
MDSSADMNAAIWQSAEIAATWAAEAGDRERNRVAHRRFMAVLLPFGAGEAFTFLDLGAGTGAASRAILDRYPRSTAILADFSAGMMRAGEAEMRPFAGRYRYVEFDMSAGEWPTAIPAALDAVVTSLSTTCPTSASRDFSPRSSIISSRAAGTSTTTRCARRIPLSRTPGSG